MEKDELREYIIDYYGEPVWEYVDEYRADILSHNIGRHSLSEELDVTVNQARNILDKVRASAPDDETPEPDHAKRLSDWLETERYVYNPDRDVYIILTNDSPFGGLPDNPVFSGDKVRSLCRMYSNYNEGSTINECAKRLEWPRKIVQGILQVLGMTHDSEPVTPEEFEAGTPIDELIEESHLQRQKLIFEKKANKKKWKQTQRAARRWKKLKHFALDPIKQFLEEVQISTTSEKYEPVPFAADQYPPQAAFANYYDFHYYGYASRRTSGAEWNKGRAEETLMDHVGRLCDQYMFFNVDKVYLPIGNDALQVDTDGKTTTRGTPVDIDGSPQEMVIDGLDLHIRMIDAFRKVGNVELLHVPGNHDKLLSTALYGALMKVYGTAEDVTARDNIRSRQYRRFGNTLFMATHGDNLTKKKKRKLPNIMAQEDPRFADVDCKMVFTGHKHEELIQEVNGVLVCQTPCLCSTNKYEHDNFWVGGRDAFSSWIIHPDLGATNYLVNPQYN